MNTTYDKSKPSLVIGIISLFIPILAIWSIVYGLKTMKAYDKDKEIYGSEPVNIKGLPVDRDKAKTGIQLGIVALSWLSLVIILIPFNHAESAQTLSIYF